ncbi:hypothetical protein BY996DRAFT_6424404 [Phakopsora pachyrhizi]|nr:hypothetical protein BY996DRAFT_6424404 [Phakopsora pachyrhizi]
MACLVCSLVMIGFALMNFPDLHLPISLQVINSQILELWSKMVKEPLKDYVLDLSQRFGDFFHGKKVSSSKIAGPNAPLFSTCSDPASKFSALQAVKHWISTGITAKKLILGIPSHSYAYTLKSNKLTETKFSGDSKKTSHLFQSTTGVPPKAGKTANVGGDKDACGNVDPPSGQWLFKELSGTKKLTSDAKKGLGAKAKFVLRHGLAGVEVFDATGDTDDNILLRSVWKVLAYPYSWPRMAARAALSMALFCLQFPSRHSRITRANNIEEPLARSLGGEKK